MPETTAAPSLEQGAIDHLRQLVQRANEGDDLALAQLRAFLDAHPQLWQHYGDVARQARAAWTQLIAGQDSLLKEAVERRAQQVREEVGGPEPSPLERLLVDSVVCSWLQSHYSDAAYAQIKPAQATPAILRELREHQQSAQRQHLLAVKQLALVRRLLSLDEPLRIVPRLRKSGKKAPGHADAASETGSG
jgi:hypothetical protein